MRIALLTTDNREHSRQYDLDVPFFGTAPEALLQGFAKLPDVEVHVVSCTQQPMKSPEKLAENIWFHSLHVPKIGWLRTGYQGCIRAVRKKLAQIQPELVHGQGTERDCALSAVFSRFPNVVTIHGNMRELARRFHAPMGSFYWWAALLETFALRRTNGVFCNSIYTKSLVTSCNSRTWQVPNAIREAFYEPAAPPAASRIRQLVNVGVICPRKRQWEILQTLARLWASALPVRIVFVGDLPDSEYGMDFSSALKIAQEKGYAEFVGTKNPRELVAFFDGSAGMVHFPSEEAFGLVVAEGLARGLAFFGAKTGGIVDIAEGLPGVRLVEDFESLETVLSEWFQAGCPVTPGAEEIIRQRYHPQAVAERHVEIYQEVLEKKGHRKAEI